MVLLLEQPADEVARGIARIGDEVKRLTEIDDTKEGEHLAEQIASFSAEEHETLVSAYCERDDEDARNGVNLQTYL